MDALTAAIEIMIPHHVLSLAAPLLLQACGAEPRRQKPPEDTIPALDTGPVDDEDPACDTGQLEDDGECVPAACGTGTWGDLQTDDGTIYVDIAASEGGDGSEAAPFASIQAGLDAAGAAGGAMVAVAAGTYPETLELGLTHDGVHLAGRCRDLVTIDASVGGELTAGLDIDLKGSEAAFSGLTVRGSRYVGVLFGSGTVTLKDSFVVGSQYVGIAAHQTGFQPTSLAVESCDVLENAAVGLLSIGSSTSVTLLETTIQDTRAAKSGEGGYGIEVYDGARLDAESCLVAGSSKAGIIAAGSDTEVTLRETTIGDTDPDASGVDGDGIQVVQGASLAAQSCQIEDNTTTGIVLADTDTTASLYGTTIRGTRPDGNGAFGDGIDVYGGASLVAESCAVEENARIGILVGETGSSAELLGTSVMDTRALASGEGGYGMQVFGGASLETESCALQGNTKVGLAVSGPDTVATLRQTAIQDTLPDAEGEHGYGIDIRDGAGLDAEDCELRGNTSLGILAADADTWISLCEVAILNTQPNGDQECGYGVEVYGAHLAMQSCQVEGNTGVGVLAGGVGTSVNLQDTTIAATKRGEIYTIGVGLFAQLSAVVEATNLVVASTEGPGLYAISEDSVLACSSCTLSDSQFAGAVVVADAYLAIHESTIEGTSEQENIGGGVGIYGGPWIGGPPALAVDDTAILDNPIAGIWLSGVGSYSLTGNTIHAGEGWTRHNLTKCGDAVYARDGLTAWDGGSGLLLENNELLGGRGAGLFLDNATCTLSGNSYADNAVDLVAQGSGCDAPPQGHEGETLGSVELCPPYDYATCGDEFSLYLELAVLDSGYGAAFMGPDRHAPGAQQLAALPILPLAPRAEPALFRAPPHRQARTPSTPRGARTADGDTGPRAATFR